MTITGRTTKDAVVAELKDGRKVVNFSIAVNDSFKPKGGERVKVTTYYDCAYWLSEKIAEYLKKGTLLEVTGRIEPRVYTGADGTPRAALNCHVSNIKILAWPKEVELIGGATGVSPSEGADDDLPF